MIVACSLIIPALMTLGCAFVLIHIAHSHDVEEKKRNTTRVNVTHSQDVK